MKIFLSIFLILVSSITVFAKEDVPKEWAEWTRIWRNGASENDKPHILMIGDSICEQYFGVVNGKIKEELYADSLTTSRAMHQAYYWKQLNMVLADEDYSLITFNIGLHGTTDLKEYTKGLDNYAKVLKNTKAKIIFIATTPLEPSKESNKNINDNIFQRNLIAKNICQKYGFAFFDLYGILIDKKGLHNDNDDTHFNSAGIELMGDAIANEIVKVFNEN